MKGVKEASAAVTGRARRTEERVIASADALFRRHGYRGTTLTDVAEAAGVAPRTVYVRFGTKAAVFTRVMDVAVVGDHLPVDLAHRDWFREAMTAPTLRTRIDVLTDGVTALFERLGPLLVAANEAELDEASVAEAAAAARLDTARQNRAWWERLHADGLMHPGCDLDWVTDTTALLGGADTYLLMTRLHRWPPQQYRRWRHRTWLHFSTTPDADPS